MPKLTEREERNGWLWLAFQTLLLTSLVGCLPLQGAAVNFLYHLICFFAVGVLFRRFLKASWGAFTRHARRFFPTAAVSLAAYYGSYFLLKALITAADSDFSNVNDASIQALSQGNLLLTALTTVVLAPLSEECLYRGLLFHSAGRGGRLCAYAVSCLAFSAIHVAGYIGQYSALRLLLCFVQYLPAGLILAGSMEAAGSIFTPIFIHILINLVSVFQLIFC